MNHKTRELAFRQNGGYCMCSKECLEMSNEIHHKLPNTKVNKKKYPLFLESIFNLCPINHDCHMSKPLPTISDWQAQIYEQWLEMFLQGEQK